VAVQTVRPVAVCRQIFSQIRNRRLQGQALHPLEARVADSMHFGEWVVQAQAPRDSLPPQLVQLGLLLPCRSMLNDQSLAGLLSLRAEVPPSLVATLQLAQAKVTC
jgi:hypothetical protein